MAGPRRSAREPGEERSKREEREERILNAAAELIERWGYNKTTIDDIARHAGVAKGTIYLHWKARDDLFWALLAREDLRLTENLRQHIINDPAGMSLRTLIRHMVLDTLSSPLAKAMLLMDSEMLGELARRDYSSPSYPERMAGFRAFLEYLQKQGATRSDIGIQEQIYILGAVVMGFLMIDQWMPDGFTYTDEEIADMTAETIERTLEPRETKQAPDSEKQQAMAGSFSSYLDQTVEIRKREQLKEEDTST